MKETLIFFKIQGVLKGIKTEAVLPKQNEHWIEILIFLKKTLDIEHNPSEFSIGHCTC